MREEADLEALITRIQSDLRAGRSPPPRGSRPPPIPTASELRFRDELRKIRGRPLGRIDIARLGARWLAPALIFTAVLIATLFFDKP